MNFQRHQMPMMSFQRHQMPMMNFQRRQMPTMNFQRHQLQVPMMNFQVHKEEESPREVFFRTLATSLKEANKYYSGKTTTWKNPFLYKTTLCENYCARSYCRYGVNCWYAHGTHELRCIPESDDLPDPAYIKKYLSFLGLPLNTLEEIIDHAYHCATLYTELQHFMSSKKSSDLPSVGSTTRSASPSPTSTFKKEAINAAEGTAIGADESDGPFGKSFHLFGESYPLNNHH